LKNDNVKLIEQPAYPTLLSMELVGSVSYQLREEGLDVHVAAGFRQIRPSDTLVLCHDDLKVLWLVLRNRTI
jgi:hypothetical protein